ncbi:MAG: sigma-54 dependent transcriptional regulator [Nitrospirota bacterium]|nr:sigma-54 dependent transcriptional regulator [Nitrospirota bacterium]
MILVVEDQDTLRKGICSAFRDQGHEVDEAADGHEALLKLKNSVYDLIVTDLKMPGAGGMDILREAKKGNPSTVVIIMTAYGSVDVAVEAMKAGACDFVQKPFPLEELEIKVQKALEHRQLQTEVEYKREETPCRFEDIVGESPQIKKVLGIVKKVAASNTTILITGDTGTGKEVIAGAIHFNSPRRDGSFVKVNCAAIPDNLLESELFGHEKGAFTGAERQRIGRFELAHRGTIFLDEIGDMNLATQAKILRVLQEREFERLGGGRTVKVDVRVIAATNRDLPAMVEEERFREDLFYRLNVVSIAIPPLRERKNDILPLAHSFLHLYNRELARNIQGFDPQATEMLTEYGWPGNVRELRNVIERAVLMTEGRVITVNDIAVHERVGSTAARRASGAGEATTLEEMEKNVLIDALTKSDWVQKDAARLLGISRRVINYKIQQFGICHPRWKKNKES